MIPFVAAIGPAQRGCHACTLEAIRLHPQATAVRSVLPRKRRDFLEEGVHRGPPPRSGAHFRSARL